MPSTVAAGEAGAAPARVTSRRARTRARLLEAAFDVFAANGFGHSTIEAVCEAAGYTRGAFYSNFTDLDELFFALYDDRSALIARQLTEALAATEGGAGLTLAELTARVTRELLLDRDWLLVKTEFLLHAARRPGVARALADHRETLRDVCARRLRELSERGRPLPALLTDADEAARAVIALYDGVTVQLLLDGDLDAARAWLGRLLTAILSPTEPSTAASAATPTEDL
ncbi:TetR/AcrR family transcriptional regulator [Streptacidiphilus anmyonensis]|uniref:TetR/AcrR family transcriptional regulator n=1 Tax=Streptacidiphilus anmyonensis TaxID=405782 RepID=UPI0005A60893|nr:TetR/AcrR family transcriptional regulator [Streptacidiphilus anmyonensis]